MISKLSPAILRRPPKDLTRYVCGFAFSHDFELVYLIRKLRPVWQNGLLNGIGGRVDADETTLRAMCREFAEETGVATRSSDWTEIEVLTDKSVEVSFFTTRLNAADDPSTMTDELIHPIFWKRYSMQKDADDVNWAATWLSLKTIANVPYLVLKGFCFLTEPERNRMEKQRQQDVR